MALFKTKYPKLIASSVDPYKLSMTVRGALVAAIPLVLVLAPFAGWDVSKDDLDGIVSSFDGFVEAAQTLIVAGTAAWAAALIVWGAVRKVLVATGVVKPKPE